MSSDVFRSLKNKEIPILAVSSRVTRRRGGGSHRADFLLCGNSCGRSPKVKVKAGMVCVGGQENACRGRKHLRRGMRKGIGGGGDLGKVSSRVVSFHAPCKVHEMSVPCPMRPCQ